MRHDVRKFLLLLGLILGSAGALSAQKNPPLVIRGTVTEVKVEGQLQSFLIDPKNEWAGRRWERKDAYFSVTLRLQFCNQDDVRLIVPHGFLLAFQTKLLFRELPSADSKVVATVDRKKLWAGDDTATLLRELERPEPAASYFALIEPGTCYDHMARIPVDEGFKRETRPSGKPAYADLEFAVPDHPYFTLQYSRSLRDTMPIVEAKERWRKLGRLVTTADNDFFFETDLIINKLPDILPDKP